jgi:serine/threonine protein kinase
MPEPASEPQRTFGHYDVESVLGKGAMGMVYLARDRRIGRKVALKTVHVEETFDDASEAREFYKRLQREAELCGALQHPNIVTLYEPGYENDVIAWMATEYIDGESLRDLLRKRKPLPLGQAVRIAEDILRGLVYAHGKGIVHRDIKPANILLTSAGEAKIADFGIARPPDSNLTAVGEMLGTPSYMSPEQVRCAPVTTRSDLFSVGSVLYEMITGIKPFGAPDVTSILRNVVELQPKQVHLVNAGVPESVSNVIMRLLAKSPDDRFDSAAAALEALQEARAEIDLTAQNPDRPPGELTLAAQKALREQQSQPERGSTIPPSVTDFGVDDQTPAIGVRSGSTLRRRISTTVFLLVIGLALSAFAASSLLIYTAFAKLPEPAHTQAQLQEFASKAEQMATADTLYRSGDYEASVAAYDKYLAQYPYSTRAREERAEALLALEAKKKEQKVSIKEEPKKTTAAPEPADRQKKPGFWRRVFGKH